MVEIRAEPITGGKPLSIRGYIDRDAELKVNRTSYLPIYIWKSTNINIKLFYEALADQTPLEIHCKETSKGFFFI